MAEARIRELLRRESGFDAASISEGTLVSRPAPPHGSLRRRTLADYARRLEQNPEERMLVLDDLLVGETWFFRTPAAYTETYVLPARSRSSRENVADHDLQPGLFQRRGALQHRHDLAGRRVFGTGIPCRRHGSQRTSVGNGTGRRVYQAFLSRQGSVLSGSALSHGRGETTIFGNGFAAVSHSRYGNLLKAD